MKKRLRCLFAVGTLFYGGLVPAIAEARSQVVVRVSNRAGFDEMTVAKAEEITAGIFRELGVQMAWQHSAGADADPPDFLINLVRVRATVMGGPKEAVGLAALSKGGQTGYLIWVFRPTLEQIVDDRRSQTPQWNPTMLRSVLLAHTIAHEVGHLLLGLVGHSSSGIMTLGWDLQKIRSACTGSLTFLPEQSETIRVAVRARNSVRYASADQRQR